MRSDCGMFPPGRRSLTLQGQRERVTSVSYAPNGQTLASGNLDQTVRLWDVSTRQEIATLQGHTHAVTSVSYAPNGRTLSQWQLG